jgi:hypothetical protein
MQGRDLTEYLLMVGVMIVLVVGVGIGVFILRSRLFGADPGSEAGAGGMLETMRRMRDRGEIPEEEYRAAQAAIVGKVKSPPPLGSSPAGARTPSSALGELRAKPGFDLTGAPLPRRVSEDDHGRGKPAR